MKVRASFIVKYKVLVLLAVSVLLGCFFFRNQLSAFYSLLTDRETIQAFIDSCGPSAPLVFIGFQILQVILAPVPGEISGFAGGYLFGATFGFIYSSIGLAVGSAINFWIGRILGYRFVRQMIPKQKLEKFDRFISHQGILVLFPLFIFPGFPKDYLSLFLGGTPLPFKVFILLAGFGRMPGTLMLSLQGEFLFERNYWVLGITGLVCLLVVLAAARYRRTIYRWVEGENKG